MDIVSNRNIDWNW